MDEGVSAAVWWWWCDGLGCVFIDCTEFLEKCGAMIEGHEISQHYWQSGASFQSSIHLLKDFFFLFLPRLSFPGPVTRVNYHIQECQVNACDIVQEALPSLSLSTEMLPYSLR